MLKKINLILLVLLCNTALHGKKNHSISTDSITQSYLIFDNLKMHETSSPQAFSWPDISDNAGRSVAQLFVFSNLYNWTEPYKSPVQQASCGTAFFIDSQGYMITNAHCVDQSIGLFIQLSYFGKERFEVNLIAICHEKDLALLKLTQESYQSITKRIGEIPYVKFGNSDTVRRADEIMALGFPLGQEWMKSTTGVVSGIQAINARPMIQISAAINPGNSGGPALNIDGLVIGVTSSGIDKQGDRVIQNVGYIIPSKDVLVFLDHTKSIKEKNPKNEDVLLVRVPLSGIIGHGAPEALIKYLNNPLPGGFYIANVFQESLSAKSGIQAGDMIYSMNGYIIDRFGDVTVPWSKDKIPLSTLISQLHVGDEIEILLYRNGEKIKINTIWELTPPLPVRFMYPGYEEIPYTVIGGMVITPVTLNHVHKLAQSSTDDLADFLKPKKQLQPAIMIAHVLPNSVAQHARMVYPGMVITEVNEIAVSTIEECEAALLKSASTGYVTFKIKSDELFVAELNRVLDDEIRLSHTYFYDLSAPVKELMKERYNK